MSSRYTGLVISEENNDDHNTFFDRMLAGVSFRLTPLADDDTLNEEVVEAMILQVHIHPRNPELLVVLRTVQVDNERMPAGTYALIFGNGLVCNEIPPKPIEDNVLDPAQMGDYVSRRVQTFHAIP